MAFIPPATTLSRGSALGRLRPSLPLLSRGVSSPILRLDWKTIIATAPIVRPILASLTAQYNSLQSVANLNEKTARSPLNHCFSLIDQMLRNAIFRCRMPLLNVHFLSRL